MLLKDNKIQPRLKNHYRYKETDLVLLEFKKRIWTQSVMQILNIVAKKVYIIKQGQAATIANEFGMFCQE